LKLSEAAKMCGIGVSTLKLLNADGLDPNVVRARKGYPSVPAESVPTWQECRQLVEHRRDRLLQRAAKLVDRVAVEIEAVRNDITEA